MHHGTKQTFAIDNQLLPALRHVLTRRMLAVFAGGKWFGKKGCSLTGTITVRPPPGTATTFKTIKAGEGKTRIGQLSWRPFSNHEDVDVDVLLVSKM